MTESRCDLPGQRNCRGRHAGRGATLLIAVLSLTLASCKAEPRNEAAVTSYYRYDFTSAREALRKDAYTVEDEQTILNNTRLGMASLADGDLNEAESALGRSFELLSTAGLNKDKTVAVFFDHEGVRIWKGEPFEQALTYHYVALLYALRGDWENTRAAAANALFRLTDFGKDQLNPTSAKQPESAGAIPYTAVDTNFALGFLMQAIGSDLAGTSGAKEQLEAALKINADLQPIVDRLRTRDYDTLMLVDYGRGPRKQAYGEDDARVEWLSQESPHGQLIVTADGQRLAKANPVCDVNAMAQDLRWNNLENLRTTKSFLGNALLVGGAASTAYGADQSNAAAAIAGVSAMALGLLAKSGARADTRYCEFMPQAIYLVPLTLERVSDVSVEIVGRPAASMLLNDVRPGTPRKPTVIYLRLFRDGDGADISWLTRRREIYSNDFTGVMRNPWGYPWILGGRDVSTPSRATLEAYQSNNRLRDVTVLGLEDLYKAEGILIGSGMENRERQPKNPSYRHILLGGTGLFTPHPYSMGYQRLMFSRQLPYEPRSGAVRNVAKAMRVEQSEADTISASEPAHQQEPANDETPQH